MTELNEITAGEYELVALQWDQPTSKPGEPFDFHRYRQGDIVTLDVAEAKRLFAAGAVVHPGSRQKAVAEALRVQYEAALAALPDSVRSEVLATQAGTSVDGVGDPDANDDEGDPVQPPKAAPKDEWIAYAVKLGWTKEAASALSKKELLERLLETPDSITLADLGDQSDADGVITNLDTEGSDTASDEALPPLPLHVADEDEWVAAAVARGIAQAEAEQLSKQELINLLT